VGRRGWFARGILGLAWPARQGQSGEISAVTRFGDNNLFRYFALPPTLPG
jgi:hypothetical protein